MTTECTNLQREILRVKVTMDSGGIYTYATNGVELWSMLNAALHYGCESFTVTVEDFKATIEEADLR